MVSHCGYPGPCAVEDCPTCHAGPEEPATADELADAKVQILRAQPGDIVVVSTPKPTAVDAQRLIEQVKEILPAGVRAMVLPAAWSVELVSGDEEQTRSSARFSVDRNYRYVLTRKWSVATGGGKVLWIMLNPSTADAVEDDPTIRRVVAFSRSWGFSSAVVANLFAYRATSPKDLHAADDPVGPENDDILRSLASSADRIVVAWGADGKIASRGLIVAAMLEKYELWCLGRTRAGQPRHPLYVKGDTDLERWNP